MGYLIIFFILFLIGFCLLHIISFLTGSKDIHFIHRRAIHLIKQKIINNQHNFLDLLLSNFESEDEKIKAKLAFEKVCKLFKVPIYSIPIDCKLSEILSISFSELNIKKKIKSRIRKKYLSVKLEPFFYYLINFFIETSENNLSDEILFKNMNEEEFGEFIMDKNLTELFKLFVPIMSIKKLNEFKVKI